MLARMILISGILAFIGCTPVDKSSSSSQYNGDTLSLTPSLWRQLAGKSDYPFLTLGDLACIND